MSNPLPENPGSRPGGPRATAAASPRETRVPPGTSAARRITLAYRVPYADTDQMGVVYYGNYLTFFERARNELMRAAGYTYRQCEADGVMLPVVHAEVDYHRPARYDDLLEIDAWVRGVKGVRLEIACAVRRQGEPRALVEGYTRHVCVSSATFRPMPPPEGLLRALASLVS